MVPAHNKKTIKMLIFAIICQASIWLLSGTFSLHHMEKALDSIGGTVKNLVANASL